MKTVNSVSGGRTSSFLAYHYPSDYNLFSVVLIDDIKLTPKDKSLVKLYSDKLGIDFIATAESDLTLKAMIDLEQLIGTEIKWLSGISFDKLIYKRKYLPNKIARFCTTEMKIRPIAEYCRNIIGEIVEMRLGIRYDEDNRVDYDNTKFKFHNGYAKNGKGGNKWTTEKYRELSYPLVDDKIHHYQVSQWAKKTNIIFPEDSNCVGCFWKDVQQLRKNFDDEPLKMNWFENKETPKRRWKDEISYNQIKKFGLQLDFHFGTGSGCNAGGCSD